MSTGSKTYVNNFISETGPAVGWQELAELIHAKELVRRISECRFIPELHSTIANMANENQRSVALMSTADKGADDECRAQRLRNGRRSG
jgi:hypothetical protein